MAVSSSFQSLPASLCLFLSLAVAINAEPQWPHNLPSHFKYFPEDEPLVKRGLESMQRLSNEAPIGVEKMSTDPDEMFYLDYWRFNDLDTSPVYKPSINDTICDVIPPPLLVHSFDEKIEKRSWFGASLVKRDFQCPGGYSNCASLNAPSLCCPSGSSCINIQNTGSGSVGCCPAGQNCANGVSIAGCDSSRGYSTCSGNSNGGCCIPGFSCFDTGCISYVTSTTTITLAGQTTVVGASCASDYSSCPSSLGGGCCPTGLSCGTNNQCVGASTSTLTTTAGGTTVVPAITATSTSDSDATAATPATVVTGTQTYAICPTGFYFCSAYYRPGCCRVGRDCSTTNCPAAASSSSFTSNGVVVVIPVGSSTGGSTLQGTALITSTGGPAPSSSCPGGWFSCDASQGGNCCPTGYSCGDACTTIGGTAVTSKISPSDAQISVNVNVFAWISIVLGIASGSGMILL